MSKAEIKSEVSAVVNQFVNTLKHWLKYILYILPVQLACSSDGVLIALDCIVALLLDGVLWPWFDSLFFAWEPQQAWFEFIACHETWSCTMGCFVDSA